MKEEKNEQMKKKRTETKTRGNGFPRRFKRFAIRDVFSLLSNNFLERTNLRPRRSDH